MQKRITVFDGLVPKSDSKLTSSNPADEFDR